MSESIQLLIIFLGVILLLVIFVLWFVNFFYKDQLRKEPIVSKVDRVMDPKNFLEAFENVKLKNKEIRKTNILENITADFHYLNQEKINEIFRDWIENSQTKTIEEHNSMTKNGNVSISTAVLSGAGGKANSAEKKLKKIYHEPSNSKKLWSILNSLIKDDKLLLGTEDFDVDSLVAKYVDEFGENFKPFIISQYVNTTIQDFVNIRGKFISISGRFLVIENKEEDGVVLKLDHPVNEYSDNVIRIEYVIELPSLTMNKSLHLLNSASGEENRNVDINIFGKVISQYKNSKTIKSIHVQGYAAYF